MAASAHDQIDRWSIVIGVVVADLRWSSNDGGESHGELDMLMEMVCSRIAWKCCGGD